MKKQITLLSFLALTAGVGFGQANTAQLPTSKLAPKNISIATKAVSNGNANFAEKAGGDLIWGDDFSGTATWNIGGDGSQGSWVHCSGPADPQVAKATQYMGAMASPTASNGFVGFDGTQYLLPGGGPVLAQNAWVESPIIDFTGLTAVNINFQERYRPFNTDKSYVEVSTDGGVTWGISQAINTSLVGNGPAYQGLFSLTVNVGGSSQGMIRFRWNSPITGVPADDNAHASGYGWFVDDVTITEAYTDNLTLQYSYNTVGAQEIHYSKFPTSQLAATAVVSFGTVVKNNGLNSQDALLNVDVTPSAYSGVSATPVTLAFGQKDTVDIAPANGFLIPATLGVYNFGYEITSNNHTLSLTNDDTTSMKMEVTTDIMAVDAYNGNPNSFTGKFTGWQGGSGDAGVGTYYEIFQPASFQHVLVGIYDEATADQAQYLNFLNVQIWKYDGTQFNALVVSQDVQITNGDFGTLVDVPFNAPVPLVAGDLIKVIAGFYDQAPVPIAFAGTVPAGQTVGVNGATNNQLASSDSLTVDAPVVRINFGVYNTAVIAPNAVQTIVQNTPGTTLSVTEGPSPATSREWKFSTTSGTGYASFSPAVTSVYNYTPKFANIGTYYVVCESTFSGPDVVTSNEVKIIVTKDFTGIEENSAPNFAVYSVENGLNVDLSATELKGATIQVLSMDGKVIAKQALTSNQMNTIKVNVPTGIYFYAISNDSKSYQGKVFIK